MTAASSKKSRSDKTPKAQDATTLPRAEHKLVSGLFAEYEKTRSSVKKKQLVSKICTELSVHAQVEEEIFYPAVKLALKDNNRAVEIRAGDRQVIRI